jgi:hypothetical protein
MSKGILFTEAMFHAVVEGRKTQTRRVMKPQPDSDEESNHLVELKPRYKVGETVAMLEPYCEIFHPERDLNKRIKIVYKYDYLEGIYFGILGLTDKWENKLFMPRKYARYFIEITGVKCEMLHDISDEDCLKEGIVFDQLTSHYGIPYSNMTLEEIPQQAYAALINSIKKGTWERNEWVWVYDFKLKK